MKRLNIYKQAKNMEKANCDLSDNELFVTLNDYKNLEQQLQAYKDKEDKLREYILENTYENEYNIDLCTHDNKLLEPILQILNEGSDK